MMLGTNCDTDINHNNRKITKEIKCVCMNTFHAAGLPSHSGRWAEAGRRPNADDGPGSPTLTPRRSSDSQEVDCRRGRGRVHRGHLPARSESSPSRQDPSEEYAQLLRPRSELGKGIAIAITIAFIQWDEKAGGCSGAGGSRGGVWEFSRRRRCR